MYANIDLSTQIQGLSETRGKKVVEYFKLQSKCE